MSKRRKGTGEQGAELGQPGGSSTGWGGARPASSAALTTTRAASGNTTSPPPPGTASRAVLRPGAGQEAGGRRQAQEDGRPPAMTEESWAGGREEEEEKEEERRPAANRRRGACAVLGWQWRAGRTEKCSGAEEKERRRWRRPTVARRYRVVRCDPFRLCLPALFFRDWHSYCLTLPRSDLVLGLGGEAYWQRDGNSLSWGGEKAERRAWGSLDALNRTGFRLELKQQRVLLCLI